jgi:hypothetical protein
LICDALRSRHGDHVHCVDGAVPIPEQVRLVKDAVVRLLQSPSGAAPVFNTSMST